MFTTPERSEKMPPIAANASGVAKRRVAASRPTLKTDSSSADSSPWNQNVPRTARSETRMAQMPSFRCAARQRPEAEHGAEHGHGGRQR